MLTLSFLLAARLGITRMRVQEHRLIRVLRIAPAESSPPQAWRGYSTCLETPQASIALATVHFSREVLKRPHVRPKFATMPSILLAQKHYLCLLYDGTTAKVVAPVLMQCTLHKIPSRKTEHIDSA